MTLSDPLSEVRGDLIQMLEPVARRARRLALAAAGFLAATLILWSVSAVLGAMVVGTVGVTLLVIAGLAQGAMIQRARDRDALRLSCEHLFGDDPDAVLVTDDSGQAWGANALARAGGLAGQLDGWCADPDGLVHELTMIARRDGSATRLFTRPGVRLRLAVHRAGAMFVWRFSPLGPPVHPAGEGLGLPVISWQADGRPQGNACAMALFSQRDIVEHALRGWRDPVMAPDGTVLHPVQVSSDDGRNDVLFLPEGARPATPDAAPDGVAWPGFEDLPVALARIDFAGQVVSANRLARGLLGLDEGRAVCFWDVVEGLGRPVADWLADAVAGRALGRPEVLRATRPSQETFVQIILRKMPGSDGLVAVLSDATEFKSLEARFTQSQKMQAIGQLAGGVAHDFNNLLTAISGHCDLLLLNRDRFDADFDDLVQIHQNANRAAALVRQLLAFSRKQTLKPEILSLESLLEDLAHLLTRLVGERINLTLRHDPDLGAIRADRRQLEQVVMNLVVNARDAMPMGGTIRIETEARRLDDDFAHGRARVPPGDYAVIRVIDEGVGIPADILDKIFEPFFTTKRVGEGTGLGLSTAYGIVKQMGGFIFADSVEGAGTTFTLFFAAARGVPAGIAARVSDIPAPAPGAQPSRGRWREPVAPPPAAPADAGTVLLVEDEAPVRAFAARALRLRGYHVFEAPDGEQALDFLADLSIKVDLFVTDVIMPGIDGPGWVAKALTDRPGTPVLFISGYTEDALNEALVRIPNASFLGKPFSLGDLSETITRQLAR
ncbi:MAG: ATP-binding protein [Paracoccaceae bacterium]